MIPNSITTPLERAEIARKEEVTVPTRDLRDLISMLTPSPAKQWKEELGQLESLSRAVSDMGNEIDTVRWELRRYLDSVRPKAVAV